MDLSSSQCDVEMNWRTTLYNPELDQEASLRDASRRAAVDVVRPRTPTAGRWPPVVGDEERGIGVLDVDVDVLDVRPLKLVSFPARAHGERDNWM
ncbi:hypothetical protein FRB94_003207 [Tulasnella sp. JGI-2019a]|nr:hypothetical protein FRB94_003207 [Tulasnella sp. JGI-2019a]